MMDDASIIMVDHVALYFTMSCLLMIVLVIVCLFCCSVCREVPTDIHDKIIGNRDYEICGVDPRLKVQLTNYYKRKASQMSSADGYLW